MKTWNRTASILLALLSLLSCTVLEDKGGDLGPGDALPQFSVVTDKGEKAGTAQLSHGDALVVFFSTACGDCREELPVLQGLQDRFGDRVRFLLISREEGPASIASYWKEHSLTLPYSAQEDRKVYNLFASVTIPRCYLCRDGKILAVFTDNPIMTEGDFTDIFSL